jgi:bifunctional DNA-binding transcriptional regulator/antitoxin component of YhaV-PrlF toxin-antitoxin module
MNKTITIDRRGTLTLPKPMRRRLALPDDGGILIAQETAEGILLRPGRVVPAEIYTEEEVAEYKRADEELADLLPKLKKSARKPSN